MIAKLLSRLKADTTGSVVVETAIVSPVLVLLGLGAYDTSRMVARQAELQSGSTDVQGIVLAVVNGTATNTATIKAVLMSTLALDANKVTVSTVYRCNDNTSLVTTAASCTSSQVRSTYVQVVLTDQYTPMWTKFGVGSAINYSVTRTVQVS
jgi:Flp pilus assembly protein TadG